MQTFADSRSLVLQRVIESRTLAPSAGPAVWSSHRLTVDDHQELFNLGVGNARNVNRVSVPTRVFNPLTSTVQMVSVPAAFIQRSTYVGHSIDGVLGGDLFNRYIVEIDYQNRVLSFYDPSSFTYQGSGDVLPLEVVNNLPRIKASITLPGVYPIDGAYTVDTGDNGSVCLYRSFIESHALNVAHIRTKRWKAVGVGGEESEQVGRAVSFNLGTTTLANPIVSFSDAKAGIGSRTEVDGSVGSEVLRRFRVIFDYHSGRLILEAGQDVFQIFEMNMSGLGLTALGGVALLT